MTEHVDVVGIADGVAVVFVVFVMALSFLGNESERETQVV